MLEANLAAFRAGVNFGETAELFDHAYEVKPAQLPAGTYRNITGNVALSYGLVAAAQQAKLPLFYASYPITPASDILHELSKLKKFGVKTLQAEDEIAAAGAAVGAAFAGSLGVTGTSGPGLDLKSEALGLALSLELPLVLVDVQRGGPSTGLPTKTEQADLLAAMYGRHGEAPLPIVAAKSPADCFDAAFEAVRLAVKYMTPVILLTDGYLANGAEPWNLPDIDALPDISVAVRRPSPTRASSSGRTSATPRRSRGRGRCRAPPASCTASAGSRRKTASGNVSYEPENHEKMVRLRAAKIAGIADRHPAGRPRRRRRRGVPARARGAARGARPPRRRGASARAGLPIAHAHLTHLSPFPADLGDVVRRYRTILVPELNLGQLSRLLRAEYLVDAQSFTRVQGSPFKAAEVEAKILELMKQ